MSDYTIIEFFDSFPDDNACLEHLMGVRFGLSGSCPKCGRKGKYHRIKKLPAYGCQWCGHHIHPMVNTPFEKSRTSLRKWYYAMYLFTTSRHGVPAKELQRQLGVTYKCAWRMGHEIRKYMAKVDGDSGLSGHVEVDEAYIGGKDKTPGRPGKSSKKTAVLGMVQRGGDIMTKVIPNTKSKTILPLVSANIEQGTTISTDEMPAYKRLPKLGYTHGYVQHGIEQWTKGIHHTNTIEGFWSRLKNSIRGTHVHVSKKYLPNYLGEFEYRYNMRKSPKWMFERLLGAF